MVNKEVQNWFEMLQTMHDYRLTANKNYTSEQRRIYSSIISAVSLIEMLGLSDMLLKELEEKERVEIEKFVEEKKANEKL